MVNYHEEVEQKISLLLRIGKVLMENGADTNRILRTMHRTAAYLDIDKDNLHIHVTMTTIMVNVRDKTYAHHSITDFQNCSKLAINMTLISAISKLSCKAIEENYPLAKFKQRLDEICTKPRAYNKIVTTFGAGIACGGFAVLFGCDFWAFIYTSICAMIGFLTRSRCNVWGFNPYTSIAISAFTASCFAYAAHFLPTLTPWHPLIACSLFIVPGIPLINAIDDALDNFIVPCIARTIHTVLMVGSMTFGIVFAIKLFNVDFFTNVSIYSSNSYLVCAIAAAVAAMGFSTIFNTPPRLLWVVALGAVIAVTTRNFLILEFQVEQSVASFTGAVIVSLLSLKMVHLVHTPGHVLMIPSVIPMIPGVLMYRLIFGIFNIHNLIPADYYTMISNGVTALLTILGIAIGVAVPNMFLRKYIYRSTEEYLQALAKKNQLQARFATRK